jgi:NADH:ubiquinone reductase (H+-translocating)
MSGLLAWLAWLFIHVLLLIGFKNRFFVLLQWGWSYITFQRGSRLITGTDPYRDEPTGPVSQRSPKGHVR